MTSVPFNAPENPAPARSFLQHLSGKPNLPLKRGEFRSCHLQRPALSSIPLVARRARCARSAALEPAYPARQPSQGLSMTARASEPLQLSTQKSCSPQNTGIPILPDRIQPELPKRKADGSSVPIVRDRELLGGRLAAGSSHRSAANCHVE